MLMPALSKAREKARCISCVNHEKQAALFWTMYLLDNEYPVKDAIRVLPGVFSANACSWQGILMYYDYAPKGPVAAGSLNYYYVSEGVFKCPCGPSGYRLGAIGLAFAGRDKAQEYDVGAAYANQIVNPTGKVIMTEIGTGGGVLELSGSYPYLPVLATSWTDTSEGYYMYSVMRAHGNKFNAAFADGHVRTQTWFEWSKSDPGSLCPTSTAAPLYPYLQP